ncbi:cupin domain-containing protein [Pseudomonas sp. Teo4]|uniref:cupin domain-containing protein n=1 Tax=Pseudomonas sp. Teo4 TaxID=3064528 RepID=UPI002AB99704|nr:cupin domain-containing protein [Pseudomonas sp. Teo4]MDZ3992760.1 hypothetical protein [Pseudomonas sp. Teo4]
MQTLLNADLQAIALMHADEQPWIKSPQAGVERCQLFRVGAEQARATSLVRYSAGSAFTPHVHSGGEEFLVLSGVFEDEWGSYPAGSYVRNPPGSQHTPGSPAGCIIFVKLRQFHPEDDQRVVAQLPAQGSTLLFKNAHEHVHLHDISPAMALDLHNDQGLELFVLDGTLRGDDFELRPWSWMRLPPATPLHVVAGEAGAKVWVKAAPLDLGF